MIRKLLPSVLLAILIVVLAGCGEYTWRSTGSTNNNTG